MAGDTDLPLLTGMFASSAARADYVSQMGDRETLRENRTNYYAASVGPLGGSGSGLGSTGSNGGTATPVPALELPGPNEVFRDAQFLNLGTAPGKLPAITLGGTYESLTDANGFISRADEDVYSLDLRGGDILSVRITGGDNVSLLDGNNLYAPDGDLLMLSQLDQGQLAAGSELLFGGDANMSYVIPRDGRYFLSTTGNIGIYSMDLRVFRPVLEQQETGDSQILFLDFDGALLNSYPFFPTQPRAFLEPLQQFMPQFNLEFSDLNRLIDLTIASTRAKFESAGLKVANGFLPETGNPGDYNLILLNSRDHADPWGLPNVSRVIVGGDVTDAGGLAGLLGIAESIDVGNFNTEETSVVFAGNFAGYVAGVPHTAAVSEVELLARGFGATIAHEAGHTFGLWHQTGFPIAATIMSTFAVPAIDAGAGPDGIVGTADDVESTFAEGFIDSNTAAPQFGYYDSAAWLAWSLASGTNGGNVSGTVFSDINRNQSQNSGEPGLAGVTVFSDANGNSLFDAGEFSDVTDASGNYSINVPPGTVTIAAVAPVGFAATTATSQTVTVALGGNADVDFGFNRVISDVTGFKWNDINGDGIRDTGEPGIAGVFIYLDLDGDDRIDLGEPRAITKADGSYSINFPGPGTFTIREIVEPGMLQTFPPTGEHVVVFDGTLLTDNFNFGNQSVLDFGDAPAPYPTLTANNGASHGVTVGFGLGALTDAEADGQPSANATGDDANGVNDDDGVVQRSPLSPGSTSNAIDVTVRNTTGSTGFLSAWIDLNQDGVWSAGERILADRPFTGSVTESLQFSLPASAAIGTTYARFRLSPTPGAGPTGFISSGEVEDYQVTLVETPEVANNDSFDIPRGSIAVPLDVLANDFDPDFNPLTITSVDTTGTLGVVVIAADGRSVFYTPRNDTLGPDSFTYTVTNETGTITGTATVNLNVVFQSAEPIAVDDSFDLPSGVSNQTLAVLENDVPSIAGGNRIITASAPNSGGAVRISSDGQRLIYSPATSFTGTEQFTYTIQDGAGATSTATVTVHLQPGAQTDDQAAFLVQTLANDGVTQIQTIQAGQTFKVRVLVEDLRNINALLKGLDAAYMDLLYTDGLVATVPTNDPNSEFPFEISFGEEFERIRTGDINTPGVLNEVGATQQDPLETFDGPHELFTLTLRAVSPGVAEFITDPADAAVSDTVLHGSDVELLPRQIRFGRSSLTIVPSGAPFTFAVDDSYPDGRDSQGNLITSTANARLNVLANDNLEVPGSVEIVEVGPASNGFVSIDDNGTPDNPSDDFIAYRPNVGFSGVEQFSYTILSNGIQSTAEVTVTVNPSMIDFLADFELQVLDAAGNPTSQVEVGDTFQLRITVQDGRTPTPGLELGVFAAYMDLLYDARFAEPSDTTGNRLGFDVEFGEDFDPNPAVGDALIPGLINEFGTFQTTLEGSADPLAGEPVELATISFVALAPGNLRLAADPADVSPFQDTLLFDPPNTVPINRISYDVANLTIVSGGSGEGESRLQNPTNRWDVNNDSAVSPIDALLVVNRLNRSGGLGEGEARLVSDPQYYLDVNGDNNVSPLDALQVVNYLNRSGSSWASGEGEATPPISDFGSGGRSFDEAADAIFENLGQSSDDSLVSDSLAPDPLVASSGNTTTIYLGSPFAGTSDAGDDEENEEEGLASSLNTEL